MEDDLWGRTIFGGRQPLTEDDFWWKTFGGRRPLTEDDLCRKTTFDRVTVYYLKKMFTTPHLDSHNTTGPKPEILSAVLTGNRISRDGRNVCGIMHVHVCRKDDIFRQRRLNHSGLGEERLWDLSHDAKPYSYFAAPSALRHFLESPSKW